MINKSTLLNLKQNQNLFLSLQSKEDKKNRWKYTLLILHHMLEQIKTHSSPMTEFDIDFVAIADKLPKLVISELEANQSKKSDKVECNTKEP